MMVGAASPEEYAEIHDLVDRAFKHSRLESTIIEVTTNDDPSFQKGDLRVAKIHGKIVSMMMLKRRPLRIGAAVVNGAIVAPVATHPGYQGKGYCSAVMRDAIRFMKTQDFDMTILWGNPWLYPHYGYSPAMLTTEVVVKPKQADSSEAETYEFRPFSAADLEQITLIYHSNTAMRTCAEVRSPTTCEWKPGGSKATLQVLIDKRGRVTGYLALGTDWGRPCAHEIGVLNDEASKAIFNHILGIARNQGLKEFYCIISPDHPFARFAFWHDSEIRIRSGGGAGMVRLLNLVTLMTKMEKEFERRLNRSELYDQECTLRISSEEGFAFLDINRGCVSVSSKRMKSDYQLDIPLSCLNPLVTGYKDIDELVKNPNVKVKGGKRAVRLIQVLFPSGLPFGGVLPLDWE
jgi:predicted acetyltransferase